MLKKELKKAKKSGEFISVWLYSDPDGFWCGKIKAIQNGIVTLAHYSKYGALDGTLYIPLYEIESVDFEDNYARAMAIIVKHHKKLAKESKIEIPIPTSKNWQAELLTFVNNKKAISTSLNLQNDLFICGKVVNVDKEFVAIHCIGKLGEDEAISYYRLEDVLSIQFDDLEGRKRLLLAEKMGA